MSVNPGSPSDRSENTEICKKWIKEWQKCNMRDLTDCFHQFVPKMAIDPEEDYGTYQRIQKYMLSKKDWEVIKNRLGSELYRFRIHMAIGTFDIKNDKGVMEKHSQFVPILQPQYKTKDRGKDGETWGNYFPFQVIPPTPIDNDNPIFHAEVPEEFLLEMSFNWMQIYSGYVVDIFETRERREIMVNKGDKIQQVAFIDRNRVKNFLFSPNDVEKMKGIEVNENGLIFHLTINNNYENEERPTFVPILEFQERSNENSNGGRTYFEYSAPCPPRCQGQGQD